MWSGDGDLAALVRPGSVSASVTTVVVTERRHFRLRLAPLLPSAAAAPAVCFAAVAVGRCSALRCGCHRRNGGGDGAGAKEGSGCGERRTARRQALDLAPHHRSVHRFLSNLKGIEKDGELVVSKISYQLHGKQINKFETENADEESDAFPAWVGPKTPKINTPEPCHFNSLCETENYVSILDDQDKEESNMPIVSLKDDAGNFEWICGLGHRKALAAGWIASRSIQNLKQGEQLQELFVGSNCIDLAAATY
uniref:Uncharacterized protein n=1 Tax=Oryza meridionalis TaxID=40149 RepID=A0A0E0EBJ2_9ORYZ